MIKTENRAYIIEKHYNTADDFLHAISYKGELYNAFERNFVFRGHSSDKYELLPVVLRDNLYYKKYGTKDITEELKVYAATEFAQALIEYQILEDFFKMCDENQLFVPEVRRMRELMPWRTQGYSFLLDEGIWLPKELYELATLAQHHGVPTRLLDWTQDINVALYFAVSGAIQKRYNPQKLTFNQWQEEFGKLLSKAKDYHLKKEWKDDVEKRNIEIWALDTSVRFQYIKDNPLQVIHPRYHENGNLGAQKGILTFWEIKKPVKKHQEKGIVPDFKLLESKTLDEQISDFLTKNGEASKPYLYRITIPESEILELYIFAKHYGCDAAHLFPGYDGVVKCMNEDEMVRKLIKGE